MRNCQISSFSFSAISFPGQIAVLRVAIPFASPDNGCLRPRKQRNFRRLFYRIGPGLYGVVSRLHPSHGVIE